jgi:hypothetical protein
MKRRIALSMVAGMGLLALVPTMAMAHTDLSLGVNLGGPAYIAPAPVVEYRPAPTYYGPTVVYRDYDDDDRYRGSDYDRMMAEHYRRHNEWVREHPWQGGHIEHPRW